MILILILVLLVVTTCGTAPFWDHSRPWGYWPSGGAGALFLIVFCIWFLMGRG